MRQNVSNCLKARQMCVNTNAISKKPPLLIAQDTNNAQSTQHKLGVTFSYLERCLTIIPRGRVGYEMVNSQRGAYRRVGYNHLISNKREWNSCFTKSAHKISLNLPDLILLQQTGKDKGFLLFTCHTSIKTVNAQTDSPGLDE